MSSSGECQGQHTSCFPCAIKRHRAVEPGLKLGKQPKKTRLCSVCEKPQFWSPSGMTCPEGHGGAPSLDEV